MSRKDKIQIYIPVGIGWQELVEQVVELRKSEGKLYSPWYGREFTTSEVVIDALQELVRRIKAEQAE